MTSTDLQNHWLDVLSPPLLMRLGRLVLSLHLMKLSNPKIVFNDVQRDAENELGLENFVTDKLAFRLAWELKNYTSPEDGAWFLEQRLNRRGLDHFGTLLNFQLNALTCSWFCNSEELGHKLLEVANNDGDSIKQLLALIQIAKDLEDRNLGDGEMYRNIGHLTTRVSTITKRIPLTEETRYYYALVYKDLAYLEMKKGRKDTSISHLYQSLLLADSNEKDIDLSIQFETLLLRELKRFRKPEVKHCSNLLSKLYTLLNNVDEDLFEMMYGSCLREAYIEVANSPRIDNPKDLIEMGHIIYNTTCKILGDNHQEVTLIESQLAINYYHCRNYGSAEMFINMAKAGLSNICDEDIGASLNAKVETTKNLTRLYRKMKNLKEAETYCREEIRLNRMLYGSDHSFVANSVRTLSYILHDQGKPHNSVK